MNRRMPKPIDILLVEDNPGDVVLTEEAFSEATISNVLNVACDGEEALAFLRKEGKHAGTVTPDLILLDLNLPKVDGRGVLRAVKGDDSLRRIPVVVMSSSRAQRDIADCYDLHANSYVTKPVDMQQFGRVVQSLENFWFSIVSLPPAA